MPRGKSLLLVFFEYAEENFIEQLRRAYLAKVSLHHETHRVILIVFRLYTICVRRYPDPACHEAGQTRQIDCD